MESFNTSIELSQRLSTPNDVTQCIEILTNLANATEDPHRFDVHSNTGVRFWTNIHNQLRTADPEQPLFWTHVLVLSEAIKQPPTRQFLVHRLGYVPLVAQLVAIRCTSKRTTLEHRLRLLHILDAMCATADYCNADHHPVFDALVQHLLASLLAQETQRSHNAAVSPADRSIVALSLSVLINLCVRNATTRQLVLRQVRASQISSILNAEPVLGARFHLLLVRAGSDGCGARRTELAAFLPDAVRQVRMQMVTMEATADVHTIEQLTCLIDDICALKRKASGDDADNAGSDGADDTTEHDTIADAFENVLQTLGKSINASAASHRTDESNYATLSRIDALLRLCSACVRLDAAALCASYNQSTNLTFSVIGLNDATTRAHLPVVATAIDTLHTIVQNVPSVASVFGDKLIALLRERLDECRSRTPTALLDNWPQLMAVFRLLETCLNKVPATGVDLIGADEFDALWRPIVDRQLNPYTLSGGALAVLVRSVYLLVLCSDSDAGNGQRSEVLRKLFVMRPVQFVLALASQSTDGDLQRILFRVARCTHFPAAQVGAIVADMRQRRTVDGAAQMNRESSATTIDRHQSHVVLQLDAALSARVQQIVDKVQQTIDQRGVPSAVHLIELYRHQLRDAQHREQQLRASHERALATIVELQQQAVQQQHQLAAMDALVYAAVADEEVQRNELDLMHKARQELAKSVKILEVRLEQVVRRGVQEQNEAGQRLKISEMEIQNYKKQIETERQKAEADEKRLRRDTKELAKKNEALAQSIAKFESRVADSETRLVGATEELAAEKLRSRTAIAVKDAALKQLEAQMADKNAELKRVTAENEENIKLRNSIMQMIQSKSSS